MESGMEYRCEVRIADRVWGGFVISDNTPIAIKFAEKGDEVLLKNEALVYEKLGGGPGIPRMYSFSDSRDGKAALVMNRLGPDLESLFQACKRKFTLKTVSLLAVEIISCIEYLHSQSYIHGDITPGHLIMGCAANPKQVYMISFGVAKPYRDEKSHVHRIYGGNEMTWCTIPFRSIHLARDITPSRRDDMESIGYVLLYFCRGSLPWYTDKLDIDEDLNQIEDMKLSLEEVCPDTPKELIDYFKNIRSLKFDEKPNYSYLRGIFWNLLEMQGFSDDGQFDWEEPLQNLCDSITDTL